MTKRIDECIIVRSVYLVTFAKSIGKIFSKNNLSNQVFKFHTTTIISDVEYIYKYHRIRLNTHRTIFDRCASRYGELIDFRKMTNILTTTIIQNIQPLFDSSNSDILSMRPLFEYKCSPIRRSPYSCTCFRLMIVGGCCCCKKSSSDARGRNCFSLRLLK